MMAFWSWHSAVCLLQKVPERTMSNYTVTADNDIGSNCDTNKQTNCTVCGNEDCFERYKLTLRQPLRGNGYGRIIETGSVCERCAPKLRSNARRGDE